MWKIVGKMNDRLRKFLDFQGISVRQFEAMIGSSDGKIAKFMATNSSLKSDTLSTVMEVFPQLSIEWLISGEGEMLKSPSDSSQPNTKELRRNYEGTPRDDREMTERRPRELPVAKQVVNGGIPLIPIDAVAGFNGWDENGVAELDCAHYDVPDFEAAHADFLIRVSGSSMYPKYSSGDILACRKIDEITFIQWGKIYVIDSRQGAMVKRLFPIEGDSAMLLCKSDNPNYPPFELPKEEIRSISIVVGAIRLE